jgi:hypothetical protein
MFTKVISPADARAAASIEGDPNLADHPFHAAAIMA